MRSALANRGAWGVAAVLGILGGLLATDFASASVGRSSIHPIGIAIVMTAIVGIVIHRMVPDDSTLRAILVLGFAVKLLGMVARYQVSVQVYGGLYDAGLYHFSGSEVADWIREEGFVARSDPRVRFRSESTTNLAYSVGWLYYVVGSRVLSAFVVAATMSYLGVLAFLQAGFEAIPNLDRRRYAALACFLPTLVYWPSSLGKEAWMVFWVGVGVLGAARLCRGRVNLGSLVPMVVGFGAAAWIRPHMGALGLAALLGALLWPTGMRDRRAQQFVALGIVLVGLVFALGAVQEAFGGFLDDESNDFAAILAGTSDRTALGGSAFDAQPVTGPRSFFQAVLTVLLRPLPWEAANAAQFLTSLEGLAIIALSVWSRRRLGSTVRAFGQLAYIRFVVLYSVGFVVAFASISNFGILARQRAQLWPALLLLLALPELNRRRAEPDELIPGDQTSLSLRQNEELLR